MTEPNAPIQPSHEERIVLALELIANCLNHLATQGIFVSIDDDVNEN